MSMKRSRGATDSSASQPAVKRSQRRGDSGDASSTSPSSSPAVPPAASSASSSSGAVSSSGAIPAAVTSPVPTSVPPPPTVPLPFQIASALGMQALQSAVSAAVPEVQAGDETDSTDEEDSIVGSAKGRGGPTVSELNEALTQRGLTRYVRMKLNKTVATKLLKQYEQTKTGIEAKAAAMSEEELKTTVPAVDGTDMTALRAKCVQDELAKMIEERHFDSVIPSGKSSRSKVAQLPPSSFPIAIIPGPMLSQVRSGSDADDPTSSVVQSLIATLPTSGLLGASPSSGSAGTSSSSSSSSAPTVTAFSLSGAGLDAATLAAAMAEAARAGVTLAPAIESFPSNTSEFITSLNWQTPAECEEINTILSTQRVELNDIMSMSDEALTTELRHAGIKKMGARAKIVQGRNYLVQLLSGKLMFPPGGEKKKRQTRFRALGMTRLQVAHERYSQVRELMRSGGRFHVLKDALAKLGLKKSTFFDAKNIAELKIVDEAAYQQLHEQMLTDKKSTKDFNAAAGKLLAEMRKSGKKIDEKKAALLLPHTFDSA